MAIALASPAYAANTALIMWNAAHPGDAETATGTDSADLTSTSLDGITITLSAVNRGTNPNDLTEGNISITNTTSSVEVLKIVAGANGYTGPTSAFNLTGTLGVTLGTADLMGQFFADNTNSLNGQSESVIGTNLNSFDSTSLLGPRSFSFNGLGDDSVTGPYGLAEELTLTLQPGAQIFVQGMSMDAALVPEPSTWVMMASGFVMVALLGIKRKRNRLATLV
jgi:hypothetical protein